MRIAVVSHIRHPIAAPFMGGMEAHSWHLVRGLVARGHDVTLFASGDSDPGGARLVPVVAHHYDRDYPWGDYHGSQVLNAHCDAGFTAVLPMLASGDFDVIHNNSLHRYPPRLARRDRIPMLSSMHVPPFGALQQAVHDSAAPWSRFTVCSNAQRRAWWPEGAPPEAHVVGNGIDLSAWPFRAEGDGTAVWAGRITPNKGLHLAVQAAAVADLPLRIFGTMEDAAYFERAVRPHLTEAIRYEGHLPGDLLANEICRASVLLFTPLWDEPFGLVAIEAMACGVPVAATEMGAVREVIGDAGCYAPPDDVTALARALRRATAIDRQVPRTRVAERFSLEAMLDAYEELYERCMAGVRAGQLPEVRFAPIMLPPPVEIAAE
ncbi:glycosyltransferase family 4 protein [Sagittula salina]|uniref:Glycosyltransferase family 4 protein n=1 Tax=Sagittula salina TaxID=2820268 RepID=A0A940MLN5_9RHOB|nr:glycosyltransferase family 4 protein [Sagittula salina]MBP0484120.1 glycosyltransferase family 4 protein [Sagittula salina]